MNANQGLERGRAGVCGPGGLCTQTGGKQEAGPVHTNQEASERGVQGFLPSGNTLHSPHLFLVLFYCDFQK